MNQNNTSLSTPRRVPDAAECAARAGVTIRMVESVDELNDVVALVAAVWGLERGDELINIGLLRAMSHAGNYIVGAFDSEQLLGACIGFFSSPVGHSLHSHLSGVMERARGRGIGAALKLHQREWALERGLDRITWTFDPLVARNAHLNIVTLGARPEEYLTDFYGALTDTVNTGERTDRILVRWNLHDAEREVSGDGGVDVLTSHDDRPVRGEADARLLRVQIPGDVSRMRAENPKLAQLWREILSEVLTEYLARGWHIVGFDRERRYLLERP